MEKKKERIIVKVKDYSEIFIGGMTKRQRKKHYANLKGSTPGKVKAETCKADGLKKAVHKYPRSYKTMPDEYAAQRKFALTAKPLNFTP